MWILVPCCQMNFKITLFYNQQMLMSVCLRPTFPGRDTRVIKINMREKKYTSSQLSDEIEL